MVRRRTGATKLGCLVQLLILAAIAHFGIPAAQKYWLFVKYQDAMITEARFRGAQPIPQIRARLINLADSLGLPEDAGILLIKKVGRTITIEAHYEETIDLPGFKKEIHFEPKASGTF
jgi:hypothetical protein